MKLLFDFFPILLFFIAYKTYDIYIATIVAIVTSVLQVALFWLKHRRFEKMHLFTLALITLLGGATLIFHDRAFFMWKPTAVNWLFAVAFIVSHWIGDKVMVERMMSHAVSLPAKVWRNLNGAWIGFFFLMGVANVYVASLYFQAEQLLTEAAGEVVDIENCSVLAAQIAAFCESAKEQEALWVDFKLFGMLGLTFLFVIAQAFYIARHTADTEELVAQNKDQ
ncbi:MAG: septation protein IspZ [Gammaproteobacteria bacterium]|nr:septation protein IspZ [Gammaproteobacteria bacterium]